MIYLLIFTLISSSVALKSHMLCYNSHLCNEGSKNCEGQDGKHWCCKEKTLLCNKEDDYCHILTPNLPLVQLIPDSSKSKYISIIDKILFNTDISSQKFKYSLSHYCEPLENGHEMKIITYNYSTMNISDWKTDKYLDIFCPGRKQRCPSENTCCLVGKNKYGCCRYEDAVCCADLIHCCPPNTVCNTETMECTTK